MSEEEITAFQQRLSSDQDVSESPSRMAAGRSDDQIESMVRRAVEQALKDISENVIPELSKSLVEIVSERIERVIQEVVPELAEGAIKKEIERLQKGS